MVGHTRVYMNQHLKIDGKLWENYPFVFGGLEMIFTYFYIVLVGKIALYAMSQAISLVRTQEKRETTG